MAYYGRSINQQLEKPNANVIDEQRFAPYPIYVVFLLAPTVYLDFPQTQFWVSLALGSLTAASDLVWMGILHWRPPPP